MPTTVQLIIGVTVAATLAISSTLLAACADHDLARAVATIGFMVGTVIGVSVAILDLIERHLSHIERMVDRRLSRMEAATARVAATERDVLTVLQQHIDVRYLN